MIKWDILYNQLIETKQSDIGELHHIVPRHSGGLDDISNLVRLSHRYHVLAHYILYRWKYQPGDKIAYKMMSGQITNPMHDIEIRNYHKQIMNSDEVKTKISITQTTRLTSPIERKKISEHRKRYINTLSDKTILTQHMQTDECRKKSYETNLRIRKENPEYFSDISKRASAVVKHNNKFRTTSELQKIYSRGTGKDNPNWAGYIVLYKNDIQYVFDTMQDVVKFTNITPETIRKRINTSTPMKTGKYKEFYFKREK
jgi:hypothetical protein